MNDGRKKHFSQHGYTEELGFVNQESDFQCLERLGFKPARTTKKSRFDHRVNSRRVESKSLFRTDWRKLSKEQKADYLLERPFDIAIVTTDTGYNITPLREGCAIRGKKLIHVFAPIREFVDAINRAKKATGYVDDSQRQSMIDKLTFIKVKALERYRNLFARKFQTITKHFTKVRVKISNGFKLTSQKLENKSGEQDQNTIARTQHNCMNSSNFIDRKYRNHIPAMSCANVSTSREELGIDCIQSTPGITGLRDTSVAISSMDSLDSSQNDNLHSDTQSKIPEGDDVTESPRCVLTTEKARIKVLVTSDWS